MQSPQVTPSQLDSSTDQDIQTEAESQGLQKSPVLRPVNRSPSNYSSNASLNGSFTENFATEFSNEIEQNPSHHEPLIDPQNYLLRSGAFSRDANASGASHSQTDATAFAPDAEAESALFRSARAGTVAASGSDNFDDIIIDNSENYLVSESENAEADQYLEAEQASAGK